MNTFNYTTWLVVLAVLMLATTGYSDATTDAANQKVAKAVASGNVQSVISALPTLEEMWPKAMGEYFQSAEEIARFLNDAGDDPAVQHAVDSFYTEVLNKRCPEDAGLVQATAYFDCKQKIVRYSGQFENMRYNKPHLLAVSRFLGEVRDRIIPNYENRGTSRPGLDILNKAGVFEASSLANPVQIQAYEKANEDNIRDMEMNGLQLALFSADSSITFKLLGACQQLRYDGNLDEEFADAVAKNARLTEKEREMRDSFEGDSEEWGR